MGKEVSISDDELEGFSAQAAMDFEASILGYKNDLLKEIGRIEAGQNAGTGAPEVTSRMVQEAEVIFSRGTIYKKRRFGGIALRVTSVISLFLAGAMIDVGLLKQFSYLIFF